MLLWEDGPKTSLPQARSRAQNEVKEPCFHFASFYCVLSVSPGHRSPAGQHLLPLDSDAKEITLVCHKSRVSSARILVYFCVNISHILSSSENSGRSSPLSWWGRGGLEARTQMFRGTCQSSLLRLHMFS